MGDDDRIERERQQQEVEAEKAAEKLRKEQAEITRKKQEDDDRIERERQQQEAAEKLRLEQEDNKERERLKQQVDAAEEAADNLQKKITQLEATRREAIKQVEQLSQSDRDYIKYVFDWYDKEPKDGRIELSELKDALSAGGYDVFAAEQMLNEYDKDGNGNLDYDEFEMWCAVTNAVESWKKSNADFNQTNWRVEDLSNIKNYTHVRLNGTPGTLKKSKNKFSFKADTAGSAYKFIRAPRQQTFEGENTSSEEEVKRDEEEEVKRDTEEEVKRDAEEEVKRDAEEEAKRNAEEEVKREEEDELSTMTLSDLRKYAAKLNKKKKKTVQGYSKFRKGDEKDLADLIRTAESKMSIVPPGELSEMLNNMTDDWASSDEELNFAMDSENEDMEFAASSAVDTDDSDLDFAESSDKKTSSGLEFAESSHTSSGLEFAASSAVDSDKSEDFAVSSSVETYSDLDFAESSGKTSSGLDFAESSAVESD